MDLYGIPIDVLMLGRDEIDSIIIPIFSETVWNQLSETEKMSNRIRFIVYMNCEKCRTQWSLEQYLTDVVPQTIFESEIESEYTGGILISVYPLNNETNINEENINDPPMNADSVSLNDQFPDDNTADYYIYIVPLYSDEYNLTDYDDNSETESLEETQE